MKITKNFKMIAAIGLIVLLTYNLIFFVLCGFPDHEATFWISWVFMMVAFASLSLTWIVLKEKGMVMRDWLFGFPIFNHSIIYIIAEFVLSTIFVIFEDDVQWIWAFAIQFVLAAVYLILAISCFLAKSIITEVDTKVTDKTRFMKLLRADAEMLVEACDDPTLKEECRKFAEAVRYSDPMSNDALYELEQEINLVISDCNRMISIKSYEEARLLCRRAHLLLIERNKKCKALKK